MNPYLNTPDETCSCGEPSTYGLGTTRVAHRSDGPCTVYEVPGDDVGEARE